MMSRAALSRLNPWMRILLIAALSVPALPVAALVLLLIFGSAGLPLLFPVHAGLILLALGHCGLLEFRPAVLLRPGQALPWMALPVALAGSTFGIILGATAHHLGAPVDVAVFLAGVMAQALVIVSMANTEPFGPVRVAACWVIGLIAALSLIGIPLSG